jgi:hypothetical protein
LSSPLTRARLVAWSGGAVVAGMAAAAGLAPRGALSLREPDALAALLSRERGAALSGLHLSRLAMTLWVGCVAALAWLRRDRL